MLNRIKQMEIDGQWAELQQLASTLPAGDDLARVYIALSKLREDAATCGREYRAAMYDAQMAAETAAIGGSIWTWAQGRTAALAADLGQDILAERAAATFLAHVDQNPAAAVLTPWVTFALAQVRSRQRRHTKAISLWQLTMQEAAGELLERARLQYVWALAEAGRPREALLALPETVSFVSPGHIQAAKAVALAAAGDWTGAYKAARVALRHQGAGEWAVFDTLQTAELYTILSKCAQAMGNFRQATISLIKDATILSRWNTALIGCLVPTLREEGGEPFAAAHPRGRAGYRCSFAGCTVG